MYHSAYLTLSGMAALVQGKRCTLSFTAMSTPTVRVCVCVCVSLSLSLTAMVTLQRLL